MEKHLRFEVDGSKAAVGPLTLHRLKALTEFGCMRCGSFKKSRIVVTFAGDWSRLLCNGCYGQLLSIWRTRSPDGSEGLSDEAVERLRGLATNGALERAAVALRAKGAVGRLLSEESFRMLATADALVAPLEQGTDLDWSAGVIMLCKAVEVELGKRLFEPLRAASQGLDLAGDLADKQFAGIARYCIGKGSAPELGTAAFFLRTAANSQSRAESSALIHALRACLRGWPGGGWILDESGLSAAGAMLAREYRNPAAHTMLMTRDQYASCAETVKGDDGMLLALIRATTGGKGLARL